MSSLTPDTNLDDLSTQGLLDWVDDTEPSTAYMVVRRTSAWPRIFGKKGACRFWTRVLVAALIGCVAAMVAETVWVLVTRRNLHASCQAIKDIGECPGYIASHVQKSSSGLTADLRLAGTCCNTYGVDLDNLKLEVEYQTNSRIHVKISDAAQNVYQVPESILMLPKSQRSGSLVSADIQFSLTDNPFSFAVVRKRNNEVLFNTTGSDIIFQSQYLRMRTALPPNPNIYGLGEHSDPFQLNTTNYIRTLWSRDSLDITPGTNLYGNHPVYVDHRGSKGTHGVFLFSTNGMDINIDHDANGQYLEYNTLGGIFDLYFMAGPTPTDVSKQYAEVVGLPAGFPYWGFGFHQCRYGYQDWFEVAEVVSNYSQANIPLETMWTDIDYMDGRKMFTLDPQRFNVSKMRELVSTLHSRQQHYVVMVDPSVAYADYPTFNRGTKDGVFMKNADGSIYRGVVWPGVATFPDWFNPNTQAWWTTEFEEFFDPDRGIDIDALWIDMNEAANFCEYPCPDPEQYAKDIDVPPAPFPLRAIPLRPIPGFPPSFQPPGSLPSVVEQPAGSPLPPRFLESLPAPRRSGDMKGLPGRMYIDPPYRIHNGFGGLSQKALDSDLVHHNGIVEYDSHNGYGTMTSSASRNAMLARRPGLKPMIITRSTYAGDGTRVGHWLGDNLSTWAQYRISIQQMLAFAAIFQIPMVGSDVCGFGGNTTELLCARWTTLGAFNTFFRNHNVRLTRPQEFYRWPTVAQAARNAIDTRYKMLDYIYTALHRQTIDGTPLLNPLFYLYPNDTKTFSIQWQFFYGDAVLVSPVTQENSTSVEAYIPEDKFYDYYSGQLVHANGVSITLTDIGYDTIPLHIRGGTIMPLRISSANTTTELRKKNFNILVAMGAPGTVATGSLYLDDGVSISPPSSSDIAFSFDLAAGSFVMNGTFGYDAGVVVETIEFWGLGKKPRKVELGGKELKWTWDAGPKTLTVQARFGLQEEVQVLLS